MRVSFSTWVREFAEDVYHSIVDRPKAAPPPPPPESSKPTSKDIMIDVIVNRPPGGFGF